MPYNPFIERKSFAEEHKKSIMTVAGIVCIALLIIFFYLVLRPVYIDPATIPARYVRI